MKPKSFSRLCAMIATAVLAAIVASGLVAPADAGQRIALVIGNSDYLSAPALENPKNDAALMSAALQDTGFSVTTLIDADQQTMKKALIEFGRGLRGADIDAGLFYYAGHGVQVHGENYLVPVNAAIASEDEIDLEAINVNDFLRVMNSSDAKVNIVILDACRDNPFKGSSRAITRGLAPVDAPEGTYIAYATAPGDVALDGDGNNSPYTLALTRAMSEPGLPIERVFKTARASVFEATDRKQVPWETSSIIGEFFFRPQSSGESPSVGNSGQGEVERAFALAQQIDSVSGWEAFRAQFGADNAFYDSLAQQKLAALKPKPGPRQDAEPALPQPRFEKENCSALAAGSLCVSSVLDPQFGNRYGGRNLFDNNPATAWVEGAGGQGQGEAIVIAFDEPASAKTVSIMNGYNKNADIFTKNSRVRALELRNSAGERFTLALEDAMGWQSLDLPAMKPSTWMAFYVLEVYPGSKYQDTAISELRVE